MKCPFSIFCKIPCAGRFHVTIHLDVGLTVQDEWIVLWNPNNRYAPAKLPDISDFIVSRVGHATYADLKASNLIHSHQLTKIIELHLRKNYVITEKHINKLA